MSKFLFITLLTYSSGLLASPVPKDWKEPTLKNKNFETKGDFDGDKKIDTAKFLLHKNGANYGLFVFFGNGKITPLLEKEDISIMKVMVLKVVKPGTYKTACGKGYWDCKKDEPEELQLTSDTIDYSKDESSNSFFVWNKSSSSFRRFWVSD